MSKHKVVLYIAMSLDGYIARPDGSVDWLYEIEGNGGDNGYSEFYGTVGSVVMGRNTYEEVLKLADEFPYADKPAFVLTRSGQPPAPHVVFTGESIDRLIPRLQQTSEGKVWIVGGGLLVQSVLKLQLLDELQIALIPTILGEGIPLFPSGTVPENLTLTHTERMGQIVMLHYQTLGS
ncbi:dihydrofolate reductase family protein [Paenibacillus sp. FSL H8-0332]|uniref:dihydrofolate reductase family protein n=1 Tax=Paenibacillus sp. FSL H8-0332 TaxID=2954742 RepID=UPI0030CE0A8C